MAPRRSYGASKSILYAGLFAGALLAANALECTAMGADGALNLEACPGNDIIEDSGTWASHRKLHQAPPGYTPPPPGTDPDRTYPPSKFFKKAGHSNDGNEGNEGNEGKAPVPPTGGNDDDDDDTTAPSGYTPPPPGTDSDRTYPPGKFFKSAGHPNDGNEGNEGNEGKAPATPAPPAGGDDDDDADDGGENTAPSGYTPPPPGTDLDRTYPPGKFFKSAGHPNDGNEGNEGNEGKAPAPPADDPADDPAEDPAPPAGDCGKYMVNIDVDAGGNNLPGSGQATNTAEACYPLCQDTNNCNAFVRAPNGKCYFKNVNLNNVPTSTYNGAVSYVMCAGEEGPPAGTPTTPTPPTGGDADCGEMLANTDIDGADIAGSGAAVGSDEACLNLCYGTNNCNAWVRPPNGKCYMKNINTAKTSTYNGATAYYLCDGETGPPGGTPPPTTPPPATGGIAGFFSVGEGACPGGVANKLLVGQKKDTLKVPEAAKKFYQGNGALAKMTGGYIDMPHKTLGKGGTYCWKQGNKKVLMGGTILIKNGNKCYLPPTKGNGSPCCTLWTWQPNNDGLYYDDCSMKQIIGGDGLYYFQTELSGDESEKGWGADPEPHIHYDLICNGCAGNNAAGVGTNYRATNKFYTAGVCKLAKCGNAGGQHQADKTTYNGQETYVYHMVLP